MEMRRKIELEDFVTSKREAEIKPRLTPEEIEQKKRELKESVQLVLSQSDDDADFES